MNRINVLLVSPKSYEDRFDQKTRPFHFFPYSIVFLTNYLRQQDLCDVDYMDLVKDSTDTLFSLIQNGTYDLIGFTSTVEARFITMGLIRKVKEFSPRTKIVVGGYFFSKTADEAMKRVREIDYVVRGEGEITLSELVKTISENRNDFQSIPGLSYRNNGNIVHNDDREPEKSIDKFRIHYPLINKPGYSLFIPFKNYENDPSKKAFPIMLGRGCNNKCIFCINRFLPYRVLSVSSAIEQIDAAIKEYDAKYFMFTEPSFTERKKFVREFCEYLINNHYHIYWYCEGRADTDLSLLDLMRKAGCVSMDFALESGSDKVLANLKKKCNIDKIHGFAKRCSELGIRCNYFTMVSLPGETLPDAYKTLNIIRQLRKYNMRTSVSPLIILPGTEVERLAKERGILPRDFSWYDDNYQCPYSYISPRESNMPHWLEHLSESNIRGIVLKGYKAQQNLFVKTLRLLDPLFQNLFGVQPEILDSLRDFIKKYAGRFL
ncbi:MAG: radical SAM protein [Phycisphaerae bacterium]|nr:radical SAM protein [Phycisphaerae bacterium]